MLKRPLILVLEDERSQRDYYELLLTNSGYDVKAYSYLEDAVAALDDHDFDAFVVDLRIGVKDPINANAGGDDFIKIALNKFPFAPLAVISAFFGNDWGTRLTRLFMETTSCFYAHIEKPGEQKLIDWSKKVLQYYNLKNTMTGSNYHSEDIRVRKIVDDLIPVVAASSLPVFLIGETGTGKEGIARLIHNYPDNPFRKGPFVAVNCAAVNDELLLSELFGHVQGAYTGAHAHRLGLFLEASGWKWKCKGVNKSSSSPTASYPQWLESCNGNRIKYAAMAKDNVDKSVDNVVLMNNLYNITDSPQADYIFADTIPGTLFLDEIGDLTPAAEAALLRALDGYGIRPLGYTGPALLPHCSIIAATNQINSTSDLRDLEHPAKTRKGIRKELYHRLAGWVLELPALRERKMKDGTLEWIMSLKKWATRDGLHFQDGELECFARSLTEDKQGNIWDGNWRELRYFYARARAIASRRNGGSHIIRKEDLEFAGKWVLLDDYSIDNEPCPSDNVSRIGEDPSVSYEDVTIRLDCVLAIDHVLRECEERSIGINDVEFTNLGLCDEALRAVADKILLAESIKAVQDGGRITNPAVDILMDNKRGALKVWWRGNAAQTAAAINNSTKYTPLVNIIEKLSPTNFYIKNGRIETKNI